MSDDDSVLVGEERITGTARNDRRFQNKSKYIILWMEAYIL